MPENPQNPISKSLESPRQNSQKLGDVCVEFLEIHDEDIPILWDDEELLNEVLECL